MYAGCSFGLSLNKMRDRPLIRACENSCLRSFSLMLFCWCTADVNGYNAMVALIPKPGLTACDGFFNPLPGTELHAMLSLISLAGTELHAMASLISLAGIKLHAMISPSLT